MCNTKRNLMGGDEIKISSSGVWMWSVTIGSYISSTLAMRSLHDELFSYKLQVKVSSLSPFFSLSNCFFLLAFIIKWTVYCSVCACIAVCGYIMWRTVDNFMELVLSFLLPWDHRIKIYCTGMHCKCRYLLHHLTGPKIASCEVFVPQWEKWADVRTTLCVSAFGIFSFLC